MSRQWTRAREHEPADETEAPPVNWTWRMCACFDKCKFKMVHPFTRQRHMRHLREASAKQSSAHWGATGISGRIGTLYTCHLLLMLVDEHTVAHQGPT
jgi:hypothetical protein